MVHHNTIGVNRCHERIRTCGRTTQDVLSGTPVERDVLPRQHLVAVTNRIPGIGFTTQDVDKFGLGGFTVDDLGEAGAIIVCTTAVRSTAGAEGCNQNENNNRNEGFHIRNLQKEGEKSKLKYTMYCESIVSYLL